MNKIHKKRIQKWVDALRSGEYKQCRCSLRNIENKYCCLGVACDIYEKQTKKKLSTEQWTDHYLPFEVTIWFGFDKNPIAYNRNSYRVFDPPITKNLMFATKANDFIMWSFKEIADAIEKTYLKDES